MATLMDEQRDAVLYAYDDESKTTSWSNLPITFVQRAGLNLADLTDEQKTAALTVLKSLLSDEAYETVSNIMAGDSHVEVSRCSPGRPVRSVSYRRWLARQVGREHAKHVVRFPKKALRGDDPG